MDNLLLRPWRRAFVFSGRATRTEYWLFYVQLFAVAFLMIMAGDALVPAGDPDTVAGLLVIPLVLFYIFAWIATLSASIRRLHDHDKSGWFYLLTFIPLVGWIFFLIMMLTPGTEGENDYGHDPRQGEPEDHGDVGAVFS